MFIRNSSTPLIVLVFPQEKILNPGIFTGGFKTIGALERNVFKSTEKQQIIGWLIKFLKLLQVEVLDMIASVDKRSFKQ